MYKKDFNNSYKYGYTPLLHFKYIYIVNIYTSEIKPQLPKVYFCVPGFSTNKKLFKEATKIRKITCL